MRANPKVMEILMDDEKLAVGLKLGLQKSTWQSGEIMNKSHYKYLEILYRAQKFIRLFTEHFELYDDLIPVEIEGIKYVSAYLGRLMQNRSRPGVEFESLLKINPKLTKSELDEKIISHMKIWQSSENLHSQYFANLVKEFDRWNNFRILPQEIQEPSAYKRRIKKFYKKHLNVLKYIPEISLNHLKEKMVCKKGPGYYWPFLKLESNNYEVVKIKPSKTSMENFNTLGLYVFLNKEDADEYIVAIYHYMANEKRNCKDGLNFWPKYRESILKAHNYTEVQKIIPQRKYLEMALKKLIFY